MIYGHFVFGGMQKKGSSGKVSRFVFLIKPYSFGKFLAAYRFNLTGVYS